MNDLGRTTLGALVAAVLLVMPGCDGCSNKIVHQGPDGGAVDGPPGPDGSDGPASPDGPPEVDGGIPTPPLTEVPLDSPPGATALSRTVVTDIYDANKFLWSGAGAVQLGVAPTTIDRLRVAVLRGRILDKDGAPLAGVTVAVLGHPELGTTATRPSGGYDLVVNGGQRLTLTFTTAGVLPAHRQLRVPVRDYVRLPDVRLVPRDTQGTAVDPVTATDLLVVRGSPITDGDGTRQATLLIAAGTAATMTMPGGTTAPLAGPFTVRATEYTVGSGGSAAMPAQLPPSSGYTYAVELSIDEADTAGATGLTFSQPVVVYVDNFLGFPVGGAVPVGFYDRVQGAWVPSNNGRILALVGVTGGLADLDLDGDGGADAASALAAAGITDAERRRLAEQYTAPTRLWRTVLSHFSAWDCNWPFGPPTDAVAPTMGLPTRSRCRGPCQRSGSIIECENQTLGEELPLTGTAAVLRYQSDRVLGRTASLSLDIPVTPASLPASVKRVVVEMEVAGRKFTTEAPPLPNQVAHFVWDGKDAYGRLLQGAQPAVVRIGYVYDGTYQTAEASSSAFGAISGTPIITGDVTRQEITLWQEISTWLGLWDAAGQLLGGWSLSPHHVYDPINRIVYQGDGEQHDASGLGLVSERVAGATLGGYTCDFSGDSGLAAVAQLYNPSGLAFGPDGSLFIADQSNGRIRHVDVNGVITTIAGTGSGFFGGDGGPAVQASLYLPQDVAVAADGALYIADAGNHRIRRVAPNGIITTYAGTGVPCTVVAGPGCGDGGPALQAQLAGPWRLALGPDGSLYVIESSMDRVRRIAPDGTITHFAGGTGSALGDGGPAALATLYYPTGLAVGPDGSVYIADEEHGRVRRVGPDGIMRTVAGSDQSCDPANDPDPTCGDGGGALAARFGKPSGVAVANDGTVFVVDSWTNRVRRVSPDGIITGVAGTGALCDEATDPTCGDGALALKAAFTAPINLALDARGDLYVVEDSGCRIRRLRSPLTGTSPTDIVVPSPDATELWVFDSRGRHQRTLDALTGSVQPTLSAMLLGLSSLFTGDMGNSPLETGPRDYGAPQGPHPAPWRSRW